MKENKNTSTARKVEHVLVTIAIFIVAALAAFYGVNALIEYNENPPRGSSAASGNVQATTWGNLDIVVPDEYVLVGGTSVDKNDQNSCIVQKDGQASDYFAIATMSEDEASAKLSHLAEIEVFGEEQTMTVDGTDWKGWSFSYDGGRTPSFQAYGEKDGHVIYVSSYEHGMNEDISIEILGGASAH